MNAGRPSKADLAERERRKEEWRRQEDRWQRQRSLIDQGIADDESIDWDETFARLGQTRSDIVVLCLTHSDVRFVVERIVNVPAGQRAAAFRQALDKLLLSELPLSPGMRGVIAKELRSLAHPERAKHAEIRAKVRVIKEALAMQEHRGEKPEDAYDKIAKQSRHASGDALRRWVKNHEHLLDGIWKK
jgi:hypothetical protein